MRSSGYGMKLFYILSALIVSGAIAGCSCKSENKNLSDKAVIARINNYELTVSDFKDEVTSRARDISMSADPEKAKEDALDELVTKKILLQEAQAQSFDKDAKFMKEIERYWEQALLKTLINKKINEFSKKIPADIKGEIRKKMVQSELDKWLKDVRGSARIRIYKESLKKVEIK